MEPRPTNNHTHFQVCMSFTNEERFLVYGVISKYSVLYYSKTLSEARRICGRLVELNGGIVIRIFDLQNFETQPELWTKDQRGVLQSFSWPLDPRMQT